MEAMAGVLEDGSAVATGRRWVIVGRRRHLVAFLPHVDVAYGYLHNLNTSFHPGKLGVKPKAPWGDPQHGAVRGHQNWNVCVAAQRFRFAHACGSRDAMQCS